MRLLVVGAGSTGGYFGGRLAQAGRDVTFLVRPRRAAQLRESGLQIVSPHGNVTVRPKLVTAGEIEAPYDAVLLGVKSVLAGCGDRRLCRRCRSGDDDHPDAERDASHRHPGGALRTTTLALRQEPRLRLAHPMCCAGDNRDFILQTHGFSPYTAVRELLRSILAANRSSREEEYCDDRRKRPVQIPRQCRVGETAGRMVVQGGRRGRRGRQRQCLCLQSRRTPDDRLRPRRQFPALLGRGSVPASARRPYGAGRHDVPDRRWRAFRPQGHAWTARSCWSSAFPASPRPS